MSVLDFMIINDELDMLEIRLKYLSPIVDTFIVIESNQTFSGNSKAYNLELNWGRFEPFHKQIKYIQIEQDYSHYQYVDVDKYTPDNAPWQMEYEMRNGMAHGYTLVQPDDVCLLGDVDELPSHQVVSDYVSTENPYEVSVVMNFHAFFLNMKNTVGPDSKWGGTKIVRGVDLVQCSPQSVRDRRNNAPYVVSNNSYHFSWMGGVQAIQNKIRSFSHTEYCKGDILDDQAILSAIENGRDVLQRPGISYQLQDMSVFPDDLRSILEQYPHLIK